MSLDELADRIDSDKSSLSRIENGDRIPRLDRVLQIADALKTTPAKLLPNRFIDDLEALIQTSETPRELYLNALRGFGRNDGLFAYGILKERINFDIGKKLVTPDDEATQTLEDADIE